MRRLQLSILLFFVWNTLLAQDPEPCYQFEVDFDGPILEDCTSFFTIDTMPGETSVWQIGVPQKETLSYTFSDPNVLITDTSTAYPENDTSSFTFHHVFDAPSWGGTYAFYFSGYYFSKLDSNDYCKFEFSGNNGLTWLDLIDLPADVEIDWKSEIPDFNIPSGGWEPFTVIIPSGWEGNFPYYLQVGDTLQFRFTFIGDSLSGAGEGIMFDNFYLSDLMESTRDHGLSVFESSVAPNPSFGNAKILFSNPNSEHTEIQVFNYLG